jgi:DNA polymerase III alpha subunit (gram-positive type)
MAYFAEASYEEMKEIAALYDYIEIMPLDAFITGSDEGSISRENLKKMYKLFYRLGKDLDIPAVMTGDVHFIHPEDAIYRSVLNALQDYQPSNIQLGIHLRTTDEMLEAAMEIFEDSKIAEEITVHNTRMLAERVEVFDPFESQSKIEDIGDIEEAIKGMSTSDAYGYLEERFGKGRVFRASKIVTLGPGRAYGYVRTYMEKMNKGYSLEEIWKIVAKIRHVKRRTDLHPTAFLIVPEDREVHDFTPVQLSRASAKNPLMMTHLPAKALEDSCIIVKKR